MTATPDRRSRTGWSKRLAVALPSGVLVGLGVWLVLDQTVFAPDSPREVVQGYLEAVVDRDAEAQCGYLDSDRRRDQACDDFEPWTDYEVSDFEILDTEQIDDDSARVLYRARTDFTGYRRSDDGWSQFSLTLYRDGDEWLISYGDIW